jgi:hypothetical protein
VFGAVLQFNTDMLRSVLLRSWPSVLGDRVGTRLLSTRLGMGAGPLRDVRLPACEHCEVDYSAAPRKLCVPDCSPNQDCFTCGPLEIPTLSNYAWDTPICRQSGTKCRGKPPAGSICCASY